jgi:hypothetical protein
MESETEKELVARVSKKTLNLRVHRCPPGYRIVVKDHGEK